MGAARRVIGDRARLLVDPGGSDLYWQGDGVGIEIDLDAVRARAAGADEVGRGPSLTGRRHARDPAHACKPARGSWR